MGKMILDRIGNLLRTLSAISPSKQQSALPSSYPIASKLVIGSIEIHHENYTIGYDATLEAIFRMKTGLNPMKKSAYIKPCLPLV